MSDRNTSCAERIQGELSSRVQDIQQMFAAIDAAGVSASMQDDAYATLDTYPLAIDTYRVVRIDLSTGGPGDWIEATLDSDGDITRLEYVFQDWFDGARRSISHGTDEWDALERFCLYFIEGWLQ